MPNQGVSRIPAVFCAAFCLIAAFVGAAPGGEAGKTLYVYTWADYFAPEAVRLFEEKHGCKVEFDYYDSNETMHQALLEAGGYDILTPSSNNVTHLFEKGVISRLDHSLLPNLRHLDPSTPALLQDADMRYSVPYTVTITGVGYNRAKVPEELLSGWDIFGNARFAKRMTMMNDMRETIGAGLKHLGYSINTEDAEEIRLAGELVRDWKENLAMFTVDQAKEGLNSGRYDAIQAYNGDMAWIIDQNPSLGFYVPKEGSALNTDKFAIASDSANPELAHAFINHFLDPEIAALNMEEIFYVMPNPEALDKLPQRIRDNPAFAIPESAVGNSEMIRNLGGGQNHYDKAWERILIGE